MRVSEGPFLNFLARVSAGCAHFAVVNSSNSFLKKIGRKSQDFLRKSSDFLRKSVDFLRKSKDFLRKSTEFLRNQWFLKKINGFQVPLATTRNLLKSIQRLSQQNRAWEGFLRTRKLSSPARGGAHRRKALSARAAAGAGQDPARCRDQVRPRATFVNALQWRD